MDTGVDMMKAIGVWTYGFGFSKGTIDVLEVLNVFVVVG